MSNDFIPWPDDLAARYRARGYWGGHTLDDIVRDGALRRPDHVAIVDGERRWTYRELERRVARMASGLHGLGLRAGDRVLVQLPNIAEFAQLFFALQRLGAVPVLALPAHRENEIVHLAELSGATAFAIADRHGGFDYRDLASTLVGRVPSVRHVLVAGETDRFTPFASVDGEPMAFAAALPASVAVLLLSGGTTGLPKLIPRTHDDYHFNARESAAVAGLDEHTRYLAVLPVAHNFPLACPGLLGTLHVGGTVVMCGDPSPDVALDMVAREAITDTALIPPMVLLWLEARGWMDVDLGSLRWLQVGGARLNAEVAARIGPVLGCRLQQVYGMAEGLLCFTRHHDDAAAVLDSQGRPLCADDELRVVDENENEVGTGGTGELHVRGPYTLRGYWHAEEYNRRAFTADGYYRTGDVVRRLPNGDVVVEGRTKDVVNRGGEKVPVEEVENLLLSHPAVLDVAIVGVPDDVLGERTCACVVARGAPPSLPDLKAHLHAVGVAAFKLPDRLAILDAFPTTKLGKVNRRALAERVATLARSP